MIDSLFLASASSVFSLEHASSLFIGTALDELSRFDHGLTVLAMDALQ